MNNRSSDSTRTDSSLLGQVRDPQNHAAWERFIARYRPMIRGWCHQWFPHEADDKACEVLSELIFKMITFEYNASKGRFRGWLKTVTHNMMAGLKKDLLPQEGDDQNPIDLAEAGEDLAARLAAEFDLERLEQAKEQVRSRVEEKTWLAYSRTAEECRKPAEVARELGMKVGTIYQAKHSVITELRREIESLQSPS